MPRRMRTLLFLAAAGLSACGIDGAPAEARAPVDAAAGEVALEPTGSQDAALLVPVYVNGAGPFNLVLDTGATFTCVTGRVAEQLQLPEQRGAVGYGAGVHAAAQVPIIRYDSLRVGNASAIDLPGCVLDLSSLEAIGAAVDGLLGLNFLRAFDVRLDFQRNVMTITAPAGSGTATAVPAAVPAAAPAAAPDGD
jgi:predicted aspartyl protease